MSVKLRIFYPALQSLLGNSGDVRCEGATVGECLADLARRHAGVRELLFDTQGRLRPPVYVYVNMEGMYKADLGRTVCDSDELILAVLAAGG
jgi:hypothetical protein